jgi:hypothetical protein
MHFRSAAQKLPSVRVERHLPKPKFQDCRPSKDSVKFVMKGGKTIRNEFPTSTTNTTR